MKTKKPSSQTLRSLDWLNFFLADVQTGLGPFLAIYLADNKWNEQMVGVALTVSGLRGSSPRPLLAPWLIGFGPSAASSP